MCLNGWGGKLHHKLLPYVRSQDPDVLCLQEVVHSPLSPKATLTYRDGKHVLDQRANFFSDVSSALPNHTAQFCPAAQGELWDGDRPVPSQWGLATFVRRSIPIIAQAQGFVHKDYGVHGFGDHPRSRSAHAVRIYDHATDRALVVGHMHGLRILEGKHDTPERATQAHKFLNLCNGLAQDGDVRVLCGDFNVGPNSETLQILETAGLKELVAAHKFPGTRNSLYTKSERFADYMLIDADYSEATFDVVYDPEVSDHCPLVLEI